MYLFIAIIFIAELIIAFSLIYFIVKADKKVCLLTDTVIQSRGDIKSVLNNINTVIKGLKDKINAAIHFLVKKKQDYTMNIIKNILLYSLLFILKGKYKKAASICNIIVMAKDWYDGHC